MTQNEIQSNAFPTTTMRTVVGDVKVADKSYDINGNLVDSSDETPVDVNAIQYVQSVPVTPLDLTPQLSTSTDSSTSSSTDNDKNENHENPDQTFRPHA